ncbi:MAG TPA: DUF2516 family protein [Micromonosporaceae bacterium]|nr:DUF2516 family protein [Micromonosporaceae bacterium]
MAIAAPIFYSTVVLAIDLLLFVVTLVVTLSAFVHCLLQRADAFPAVGTLPKGVWLAIIGISMLLSLLLGFGPLSIFGFIAIVAAAVYLLDVRPALRDATGGKGPW